MPGLAWLPERGETDFLLSMARRRHDQLVHQPCGVHKDDGFDPDNEGWFEVEDGQDVCYACAALEQWKRETKAEQLEDGTQPFLHLTGTPEERRGSPDRRG